MNIPNPSAPPDLDFVLDLERKVWEALVRGDASADERLLHDDFLGVYATGFGGRSEHVAQLAEGPVVSEFQLSEARLLVLHPDIAILAYRVEFRRPAQPELAPPNRLYISSAWRRFEQGWKNVFSQDTSVA
jgi:hypothetical protein